VRELQSKGLFTNNTPTAEQYRIASEYIENFNRPKSVEIENKSETQPINSDENEYDEVTDENSSENIYENIDDNLIKTVENSDENFSNNSDGEITTAKIEPTYVNDTTQEIELQTERSKINLNKMTNITNVLEILKLVPSYDGETSELNEFLICIIEAEFNLGADDKAKFVKLLKTKLKGNAFRVVNGRNFTSIDELKAILEEHFKILSRPSEYLTQINSTSQKVGEKIKDYAERLRQLAHRAKHAAEVKYTDMKTDAFNAEINELTKNA
jgi:hypothetical protein